MRRPRPAATAAKQYDNALLYARNKRQPPETPHPTAAWPPENVRLLEQYAAWLLSGGTAEYTTHTIYLPMAGHVLGLALVPHAQIDLERDFERAFEYVQAKGTGTAWLKASRNGLDKFKRFLRLERGLGEPGKTSAPFDPSAYSAGLPAWLVSELSRYERIQQKSWRTARLSERQRAFWSTYSRIWRFLCQECGVQSLAELKRRHLLDYLDRQIAAGYSVTTVNFNLRMLRAFLLFLQEEGYSVPQSLLRVPSLKQPDNLPRYLTDEQVKTLREEIERGVRGARTAAERRQALLDRAAFHLLWQCGLRVGEVEELRLEDLDLGARRISVRSGKGLKDRSVYLTATALAALQSYLAVRGEGASDHIFLFRNAPLGKDFIRSRLRTIGKRVGVKVFPHRLRHTCATQLLNAGCRITSIQAFLGHKKLNTTMIYARAHDQSVADDYFAAMQRVEQRLEILPPKETEPVSQDEIVKVHQPQILAWVEQLALPELCLEERMEIAGQLKRALFLSYAQEHAPPAAAVF